MQLNNLKLITVAAFASLLLSSFEINSCKETNLNGAWQLKNGNAEQLLLFSDGYFTHTSFSKEPKQFVQTRGGNFTNNDRKLVVQYEFNTKNNDQVGQTSSYNFNVLNDELTINLNGNQETWKRLDDGSAPLAGVWHITERMQDDKLVPIHRTGTRKTLKILTGSKFQWAAIDPGKKEFSGTGGGTYSFVNGKYTENIEFFSRDNNRVGASLEFDGKLENGKWHHSGLSSKGDKIYEVWSRVSTKE